jgi:sodium/potassium-transporting ATPase subunit beta
MIWVSCEGKTDDDKRNLGSINYLPRRGFAGFHFPCKSDKLCLSPLLALRFERPKCENFFNIYLNHYL